MNHAIDTPVLIVGGGPVGLALALDLGQRGIRSTLIERDHKTAAVLLAKAGTLNERTMEIFRRWGIYDAVVNCGFPDDFPMDTVYCTSLDGFLIGTDRRPPSKTRVPPEGALVSLCKCPQFQCDPILADAALKTGKADIRYSTEFVSFEQDADGVTALCRDLKSGAALNFRSRYLVGCDGAASRVRTSLGIPFEGKKLLSYSVSAMVRVPDLGRHTGLGLANRYMFIDEGGTWANLTAVDGHDLWRFTLMGSRQKQDLDSIEHDMAGHLARAFGKGVTFEVQRTVPWRRSECLAERWREGRALLAGDAAHTTSPTGGHGLNTGIGDVFGLAWMLEALLKGWGGAGLLDAYGRERRPVAQKNIGISTQNFNAWIGATDFAGVMADSPQGVAARERVGKAMSTALVQEWWSPGVALGYRFEGSSLIVGDGTPEPPFEITNYTPTARPGHRAPHAWLPDGRSLLDLFGAGFVLLRFAADASADAVARAAGERNVPLQVVDIDSAGIAALYQRKLVLVRPDGHVAWRGDALPADCASLIDIVRGAQS